MLFNEEKILKDGHEIVLRPARAEDAQTLADAFREISGETPFLSRYPDEVTYTLEDEQKLIEDCNGNEKGILICAFVDGEYAGNCSFKARGKSRRNAHRAGLGIGLYEKFTGHGLGTLLMERMVETAARLGYEQMELSVLGKNLRAQRLYKRFGFTEYGRLPNAFRYDNGTYDDEIFMVKILQEGGTL